jgi:hypothetical protein
MKTATFDNTVSILVQAYLNDTLKHGSCCACAVGNIVADALGIQMTKDNLRWPGYLYPGYDYIDGLIQPTGWGAAISTCLGVQEINKEALTLPVVSNQIKATGYCYKELARIELAFENEKYEYEDDDTSEKIELGIQKAMFSGLMAVVDVLAEIHGIDLTAKEEAKKLFVRI